MIENETEQISLDDRTAVKPTAWTPGVVLEGNEGEITTKPQNHPFSNWDDILANWGLDPDQYEIIEPVKLSVWDQQTKDGVEKLYSAKAGIRLRQQINQIPYDDLVREIKRHRKLRENLPEGDSAFVVCIADLQSGKADFGGTNTIIKRFIRCIDGVENRIRDLRKLGRKLDTLVIVGLGDLVEGCLGQYAAQTFTIELNRRDQVKIARRLIRDAIARWSKMFNRVIVTAVPGNHGMNSNGSNRVFTDVGDNDDVAIFETLQEVFSFNQDAYGHIEWAIPKNEIFTMVNLFGIDVGFIHGHITKNSGTPQQKIKTWWEDQTFGEQPIGRAKILISGHYHHLSVIEYGRKTAIQAPALDDGSEWYQNLTGADSPPGMLTLVVGKTVGLNGWTDLFVVN